MPYTLKERTCVNRDYTAVVPCDSEDSAFILGAAGRVISDELAARLGLTGLVVEEKTDEVPEPTEYLIELIGIPGISDEIANALIDAGFATIEQVRAASDKDLLAISGIGRKRLEVIREHV